MKSFSIRVRLSLWYLLVLCASLALLGLVIFAGVQKSIATIVDGDLQDRLKATRQFMTQQMGNGPGPDLQDEFQEFSANQTGGALLQISDDHGNWLFQSASIQKYNILPVHLPSLGDHFNATFATIGSLRVISGEAFVHGTTYSVQTAMDVGKFKLLEGNVKWLLLISTPFAIALALAGGYWLSGRALKPVKEITERARVIGAEDLSLRVDVPMAADEMRLLAETLNQMLQRIEKSFQRTTQFTADASHELRTPVAIIRTTAEVALRYERNADEYRKSLRDILDEAEHSGVLIDELLTLVKADAPAAALVMRPIQLHPIVQEVFDKAKHLAAERRINISLTLRGHDVLMEGDREAVSRMFLAVLDNAVKYTPAGGEIKVTFEMPDDSASNRTAAFAVRDSGIGISPDALPYIFERFYRADMARNRALGGFGLGLAIARAIAHSHRADITAESADGGGSIFRISFTNFTEVAPDAVKK